MSVESGLGAPAEQRSEPRRTAPSAPTEPSPVVRGRRGRAAAAEAEPAPSRTPRRDRPRRQGRRVRRVVRRIELWSVLKVSLGFNAVMLGVALISVALLWGLANTTGLVDDLEGFLRDSGFDDFRFQGDQMFRQVAFLGALIALALTVFTVLAVALVNLISEVTGGIRFVVIEEITPAPAPVADPVPTTGPARSTDPGPGPAAGAAAPFPRVAPLPPVRPRSSSTPPTSWPDDRPAPRAAGDGPAQPSGRRPRRD